MVHTWFFHNDQLADWGQHCDIVLSNLLSSDLKCACHGRRNGSKNETQEQKPATGKDGLMYCQFHAGSPCLFNSLMWAMAAGLTMEEKAGLYR
jgi:hypothetical protein